MKQIVVGAPPSGRRSLMDRASRRLADGSIDPSSINNKISVLVYNQEVSTYDFDKFVLRLCRVDDLKCEFPIANTTDTIAAAAWASINIPSFGPTCPTATATYYIQVGYHFVDDGNYLGDVVTTRSSVADDIKIIANVRGRRWLVLLFLLFVVVCIVAVLIWSLCGWLG